jgi:hypothetical protein
MYIVMHTASGIGSVNQFESKVEFERHIEWLMDNAWPFSVSYGDFSKSFFEDE